MEAKLECSRHVLSDKSLYEMTTRLWQGAFCLVAVIAISPILGIISLLIKLTSRGPVLFRSLRIGKEEEPFTLYKFRTLREGAEKSLPKENPKISLVMEHTYPFGRFLRMSRLDELPQLFNILKGDMNLVGPRPRRWEVLEKFKREIPHYTCRFQVKPGITGLAQVRGGYDTPDRKKLVYDLKYIEKRCLALDFKVLYLTTLKLFHKYLTVGTMLFVILLLLSFVPRSYEPWLYIVLFSHKVHLLHILIIDIGLILMLHRLGSGVLYIYRSPLLILFLMFFLSGIATAYISVSPYYSFRGTIYYLVTGFAVAVIIMNTKISGILAKRCAQAIALVSLIVATVGAMEALTSSVSGLLQGDLSVSLVRSNILSDYRTSLMFGRPMLVSTYLVLTGPLILCYLYHSTTKARYIFWMVSAMLVLVEIFLNRSVTGLAGIFIAFAIFLSVRDKKTMYWLMTLLLAGWVFTVWVLGGRSLLGPSPEQLWARLGGAFLVLSSLSWGELLFGVGTKMSELVGYLKPTLGPDVEVRNMLLALIVENGLVSSAVMVSILAFSLREIWASVKNTGEPILADLQLGIFSSLVGIIICMGNLKVFHDLTLQVMFWGILGLGLGIRAHHSRGASVYKIRLNFKY